MVEVSKSEINTIFWDLMSDIVSFDVETNRLDKHNTSYTKLGQSKLRLSGLGKLCSSLSCRFGSPLDRVLKMSTDLERKSIEMSIVKLKCIILRSYKLSLLINKEVHERYYDIISDILHHTYDLYDFSGNNIYFKTDDKFDNVNIYQAISVLNLYKRSIINSSLEEYNIKFKYTKTESCTSICNNHVHKD